MPWISSCADVDPTLVTVVFSGTVTGADLRDATLAMAKLGQERQVMRYLVDGMAVVDQPGELEVFLIPSTMYDQVGFDRRALRIAVVVPRAGRLEQIVRFYETACLNRGWRVKMFDAFEPAIAWLGVPAPGA